MGERIVQVDAFTGTPFGGNPAAVCFLEQPRESAWMQRVAREMNLSETAFLEARAPGEFGLRWFTPAVEVALCGHATLASAHSIWEEARAPRGTTLRFQTQSGILTAAARDGWIEMDFPAKRQKAAGAPEGLEAALGVRPRYVGRNQFDYLVEVESDAVVRALKPDPAAVRALGVRGVMVTSRAAAGPYDFISRFFAPGSGIDEDPVTGSAHCCLGPFWAKRLGNRICWPTRPRPAAAWSASASAATASCSADRRSRSCAALSPEPALSARAQELHPGGRACPAPSPDAGYAGHRGTAG